MTTPLRRRVRVLVTGSRTLRDRGPVDRTLSGLLEEFATEDAWPDLVVVHGDARQGADRFAREWVERRERAGAPVEQERHPADWQGPLGRGAGPARNTEMVAAGADVCVTFIEQCGCRDPRRPQPHGTHGSVHCATQAAAAGIPVRHVPVGGR